MSESFTVDVDRPIHSDCNHHPGHPHEAVTSDYNPYVFRSNISNRSICIVCAAVILNKNVLSDGEIALLIRELIEISANYPSCYHDQFFDYLRGFLTDSLTCDPEVKSNLVLENLLLLLRTCSATVFSDVSVKIIQRLLPSCSQDEAFNSESIKLTASIIALLQQRLISPSEELLQSIECVFLTLNSINGLYLPGLPNLIKHSLTLDGLKFAVHLNYYCEYIDCDLLRDQKDIDDVLNAIGFISSSDHHQIADSTIGCYISLLYSRTKSNTIDGIEASRLSHLVLVRLDACRKLYSTITQLLFHYLQVFPSDNDVIVALDHLIKCPEFGEEVDYGIEILLDIILSAMPQCCVFPLLQLLCSIFHSSNTEVIVGYLKPKADNFAYLMLRTVKLIFASPEIVHEPGGFWKDVSALLLAIISFLSLEKQTYLMMWSELYILIKKQDPFESFSASLDLFNKLYICQKPIESDMQIQTWLMQCIDLVLEECTRSDFVYSSIAEKGFSLLYTILKKSPEIVDDFCKSSLLTLKRLLLYARSTRCLHMKDDSSLSLLHLFLISLDDLYIHDFVSEKQIQYLYTEDIREICHVNQNLGHAEIEKVISSLQIISLQLISGVLTPEDELSLLSALKLFTSIIEYGSSAISEIALFYASLYILKLSLYIEANFQFTAPSLIPSLRLLMQLFPLINNQVAIILSKCATIWNWVFNCNVYPELLTFRTSILQSDYYAADCFLNIQSVFPILCAIIQRCLNIRLKLRYIDSVQFLLQNGNSDFLKASLSTITDSIIRTFVSEIDTEARFKLQNTMLVIARFDSDAISKIYFEENWRLFRLEDSFSEQNLYLLRLLLPTQPRFFECIAFNPIDFQRKAWQHWPFLTRDVKVIALDILTTSLTLANNFEIACSRKDFDILIDLILASTFSTHPPLKQAENSSKRESTILIVATKAIESTVWDKTDNCDAVEFINKCLACDTFGKAPTIATMASLYIPKLLMERAQEPTIQKLMHILIKHNSVLTWNAFTEPELDVALSQSLFDRSEIQSSASMSFEKAVLGFPQVEVPGEKSPTKSQSSDRTRAPSCYLSPPLGKPLSSWFAAGPEFEPAFLNGKQHLNNVRPNRKLFDNTF